MVVITGNIIMVPYQLCRATTTHLKITFRWRHNERDCVSNHQPYDCLLNRLFRHRWQKTSKHRVTGLCEGNSPVTGEFPAQRASNAEKCFHLMTSSWGNRRWNLREHDINPLRANFFHGKHKNEICSDDSNWQKVSIGSDNSFAQNRQQTIVWTTEGIVCWCMHIWINIC